MDNKIKRLLSDTMIFAIGNGITKFILFFLMPLYTSVLTTAEYGVSDILNTFVELIIPIFTLCMADAIFRFSVDENIDKKTLFSIGLVILLKGFFVLAFISLFVYATVGYEYTFYVFLMYVSYSIKLYFGNYLRGLGKVKVFTFNGIVGSVFLVFLNLLFLIKFKMGIQGYLLAIVLSNSISAIGMFLSGELYYYVDLKSKDLTLKKDMLHYSLPIIPNTISWWINTTSSRYILLLFQGVSITGLYSAASKLPAMINILSTIFQQAWLYSSAKEYKNNDNGIFYSKVFTLYSSFIITACSGIILIIPLVSKIVLQGEFYVAWRYVPLLLLSSTLGCYSIYFGGFYTAAKKSSMLMMSTVIGSGINLLVCFILIPKWSIYGALIGGNLSYLFVTLFRAINTKKYVELNVNWNVTVFSIILTACQAIYVTFADNDVYIGASFFFLIIAIINLKDLMKKFINKKSNN